jgi:rubrerythrin
MCRPINEGGQRCAAHTRAKEQQTRARLAAAIVTATPEDRATVLAAHETWVAAAIDYASTEEGRTNLAREETDAWGDGEINHAALLHSIVERGESKRQANNAARSAILTARDRSTVVPVVDHGSHWVCQNCHAEGEHDGPARCPNCASDDVATFLRTEPAPAIAPNGLVITPAVNAAVDRRKAAFADKQEALRVLEELNTEYATRAAQMRVTNPMGPRPRRGKALVEAERAFDAAEAIADNAARDVEMAVRSGNVGADNRDIMTLARSLS